MYYTKFSGSPLCACSCSLLRGDLPEDIWSGPVQLLQKTTKLVSQWMLLATTILIIHPLSVDALVILTSFVLLIVEAVSPAYSFLAVFRPVKFIRLLHLKRRYREISKTLYSLSERLVSVGLLLFVIFYAFAIIGMEFFSKAVFEGCW